MKKQINPTIKAHLIRGAFYLLLLVTLCAIPFALAQRNTMKRTVAKAKTAPAIKLAATGARSGAPASLAGVTQQRRATKPTSQGEAPNAVSQLRSNDVRLPNLPRKLGSSS